MKDYDHKKIEPKWQKEWDKKKTYSASTKTDKPKYYALIEFPYPSGAGLHVGHIRSNTAMDIIARKRRAEGFNVLYPIGWDAFGLPTENYAIKTGKQPEKVTKENTDMFRKQLKALGFSFDWSREINTTDPKYYKWTQWIFLQFLKKNLAYKKKMTINWCPKDKIGLANEEVVNGACERCGTQVEKQEKEQWMLAITKYAERLNKDLDSVNYLEKIKIQQRNWIGKSEGTEINFKITFEGRTFADTVKVFTTRPDTIFGATYIVLAPEHPFLSRTVLDIVKNSTEVEKYINKVKNKTDIERTATDKEKTGVELRGIKAINPATKEEISVWVADYILANYGTGAIMAVPAHDERDYAFANRFSIPIKQVIAPYIRMTGIAEPCSNKKTTFRKVVTVILKHYSNDEYLLLKQKDGQNDFVGGGIEEGESAIGAALREVFEETGYTNMEFKKELFTVVGHGFKPKKDVNCCDEDVVVLAQLKNEIQGEFSEENKGQHEVLWVSGLNLLNHLTKDHHRFMWNSYVTGTRCFTQNGTLINSGKFSGVESEKAKQEITTFVGGKMKTTFKLRDWIFSRQRYWGEPIPVIHCAECGIVPVPEKDLPVKLPKVKNYKPTDSGESPLANIASWVNVKCPQCKGKAKRETDTMPNWAGSSWYFLRYTDPKNIKAFADIKNLKYWLGSSGVDWYNGGNEHTTLHLLYSRFWHKFLFDLGFVPTSEPYAKRTSHGLILADDGTKFSKSKGNGIDPQDIIKIFGADTLRMYEMFMGPFDQAVLWNNDGLVGPRRFLEKVWRIAGKVTTQKPKDPSLVTKLLHRTIKKVSEDTEEMRFNTAVSSMMILATEMENANFVNKEDYKNFLQILAPFAPHITEELWSIMGGKKSISISSWPAWDEKLMVDTETKIIVQINGKVRAEIIVEVDASEEAIKKLALCHEAVIRNLASLAPKKIIYVKNKLINIVV